MKLHFEDNLDYQKAAVESVVNLFKGQEISCSEFTVSYRPESSPQASMEFAESGLGIGNRLQLVDEEILKNLRRVQLAKRGVRVREGSGLHSCILRFDDCSLKFFGLLNTCCCPRVITSRPKDSPFL